MPSFYSTPIPEPISASVDQLAQIHLANTDEIISVYWYSETRQIVLNREDDWYIQPNGSVLRSLAALLHCEPHHLVAESLFFFETPGHGVAVDRQLSLALYNCEWSDYACDKISIQFALTIDASLTSAAHRMSYVVSRLYDSNTEEEDEEAGLYDDMPALIMLEEADMYADMPALTLLREADLDTTYNVDLNVGNWFYDEPVRPRHTYNTRSRSRAARVN